MENTALRVRQAIAAARAGKLPQARILADRIVRDEPGNLHTLFLLSVLADKDEERIDYLDRVLAIDPNHEMAGKRLAQLTSPTDEAIVEKPAAEVVEEPVAIEAMAPEPLVEAADEAVPEPHPDVGQAPVWHPDQTLADEPLIQDETLVLEEGLAIEEGPIFEESLFSEESPVSEGSISLEGSISEETLISDKALVTDEDLSFDEAEEQARDKAITLDDEPAAAPQETAAARRIPSFLEQSDGNSSPDWLEDDDGYFEGDFYEEQAPDEPEFRIVEAAANEMEPLPDWLAEEPTQEWVEGETAAAGPGADWDETAGTDTDEVGPVEGLAETKAKRPNRNLEILLLSLVVLAVIIVAALAYVIIVQPTF